MLRKIRLSIANIPDDDVIRHAERESMDSIKRRKLESILSEQESYSFGQHSHIEDDSEIVTVNPFKVPFQPFRKTSVTPATPIRKVKKKTTYVPTANDSKTSMILFRRPKILGLKKLFSSWRDKERKDRIQHRKKQYVIEKWRAYTLGSIRVALSDGLEKFNAAIHALNRLDELGYRRSKQQIEFHTEFLGSMVQQIFGSDLNKYLNDILESLGLKELNKDVAVCCPRRFGKTTSVALFTSSMVYTQGDIDFVIYSIAMRTSRMLTARIYQMIVGLAGGTHVILTSNQEVLTIASIAGGASTVYSYPAASAISAPISLFFLYIYIYVFLVICVYG